MNPEVFRHALVLTGPTGSGKSALAVALAERLGAEIVSMDSMALYRCMDIGTAKPDPAQRQRVPHHLIDVLDPSESASVAWWLERAAESCRDIEGRGCRALFVGGTPLYLKALLGGLFDGPPANPEVRDRLTRKAEQLGRPFLHERLARVDPEAARRLHPNDLRRVVRALEVWELTGQPLSSWQGQWANTPSGPENRCLWLNPPRADLYCRIDMRVERMIEAGWVEEARALRQQPISREAAAALGYAELSEYLDGGVSLAETVRRIQTRSRQFAKRQLTWFRHIAACRPITEELAFAIWAT